MATELAKAYVQIVPSAEGISGSLSGILDGEASAAGQSAGSALTSGLSGALGAAGAAMGAVTAAAGIMVDAIVEAGDAFLDAAISAAEYGDSVDKMSQKAGFSAEAWQEWDAVLQHSGSSASALIPIMKTLSVQAEKNNEAFQMLGITEEELATLSQEDLFARVIEGLQGMEEGTERTYIASQLLGRGATELGALLNTSAEDTQAMKDRLHELGGVMSDEDVAAAAQFEDSLQDMTTGFDALQRNLVSGFLPAMSQVMDGVSDIFAGDTDKGLENISAGIEAFLGNIGNVAPKILETGTSLVSTLAQSIMSNLPKLISVGGEQMVALMQGLSGNAGEIMSSVQLILSTLMTTLQSIYPKLLPMGFQLLETIVQGVSEALPVLIPMAAELFSSMWSAVSEYLPKLPELGITILSALADGLISALPTILSTIPLIIGSYLQFMIGMIPLFVEMGTTLLTALISDDNLSSIITTLVMTIPTITMALIGALVEATPAFIEAGFNLLVALVTNTPGIISSLLSSIGQITDSMLTALADLIVKFEDIGGQIMQGLADGIVNAGDAVVSTAKGVLDKIPQGAKDLFQINSPSKLFEDYGEYIDMGLAMGITGNSDLPENAMKEMSGDLLTAYEPELDGASASNTMTVDGAGGSGDIIIPVYIGQERLDELIVTASNRVNYMSGGRV